MKQTLERIAKYLETIPMSAEGLSEDIDPILMYKLLKDIEKAVQSVLENKTQNTGWRQQTLETILSKGELAETATVRKFRTVQREGAREVSREIAYYNLDMIIAVGYRVRSNRGTQFRQWATEKLKEYLVKGFTMNDELLKNGGKSDYFDELLARIRDIRSSEKVFYRKVLDIFSTSTDYNPQSSICIEFFSIVQNKFHYAVHGQTASELIYHRSEASKPNMGLTNFKGKSPSKGETYTAKIYQPKTKRHKAVYFRNELLEAFKAHPQDSLFEGTHRQGEYYAKKFQKLKETLNLHKKYCLYAFRHSFGTRMLNKTKDLHLVSKLLGHSNINITAKHYALNNPDREKSLHEALVNQIYQNKT